MMSSLVSFGYQKIGLTDETRDLRDLDDARLAIELLRADLGVVDRELRLGRAAICAAPSRRCSSRYVRRWSQGRVRTSPRGCRRQETDPRRPSPNRRRRTGAGSRGAPEDAAGTGPHRRPRKRSRSIWPPTKPRTGETAAKSPGATSPGAKSRGAKKPAAKKKARKPAARKEPAPKADEQG